MAQRPRFGGGKIMETKATKNFSLPNDSERETQKAGIMEESLHIQSREPKVLSIKDREDAGEKKKRESETLLDLKDNSQYESQSSGEKEVKSFQSKGESFIKEHGWKESLYGDDQSTAHTFPFPRSQIQNDPQSMNQDSENKECSRHGSKADIKQLMSVLQSLGIHVEIKPYIRSATSSTKEMERAEEEGVAKKEIFRQVRPIDLNVTSYWEKKSDNKSSKDDKKRHDDNFLFCKNLFLKDRHGHYFFIIAEESAIVDFKVLKKQLNAARNLSFADAAATENILGEKSGGLNPFVAMRDSAHEVRFVLHQSLLEAKSSRTRLAFHPLDSSRQVEITVHELIAFLEYFNKQLEILPADTGMSSSGTSECLSSDSDQGMEVKVASRECKQSKGTANIIGKNNGNSQALKLNEDNQLVNPTINGKPLWKMHLRKGKLKTFLKATNDNTIKFDDKTSQTNAAAAEESSDNQLETASEASSPNPLITKYQMGQSNADDTLSESRAQHYEESKLLIDELEKPKRHPDLPETANSSTLPEITQFYNNLSDLCIEFQDLRMGMSTTRDIGPSIGCKCFFLKDRRQNYYLIITHEYYELDHGRLKKALKPRKKLDHAEPADILENLGVQPSRMTPFSCITDRAIAKNVMVFMTAKVRPSEVILCIQHPFAEGRRLIMKSGELQRFLSNFRSPVGEVEEKAWPDKFNRIFTRFTDQSYELTLNPEASSGTCEQQQTVTSDSPGWTLGREQQTGLFGENEKNNGSSKTERHRASSLSQVCRMLGKAFLLHIGIDTYHLTSSSMVEKVDVSSNCQISQGSSVDPLAKGTQKEDHDNLIRHGHEESPMTGSKAGKVIPAWETTQEKDSCTMENVNHGEHDLASTECALDRHFQKSCQDAKMSLTVYDILQHLRDIDVDFTFTDSTNRRYAGDEYDQSLQLLERKKLLHVTTPQSQENPMQMGADAGDLPRDMPSDTLRCDVKKGDDHDNAEICSTAYLCDQCNHYIIVGGESDYLSKRRFRRLFHIPGPLRMGDEITPGLTATPFSLYLALKEGTHEKNLRPNIYVILFTSVYLDPETKCLFHLDEEGSSLTMTSSQLERFITKTGMECWYVP